MQLPTALEITTKFWCSILVVDFYLHGLEQRLLLTYASNATSKFFLYLHFAETKMFYNLRTRLLCGLFQLCFHSISRLCLKRILEFDSRQTMTLFEAIVYFFRNKKIEAFIIRSRHDCINTAKRYPNKYQQNASKKQNGSY